MMELIMTLVVISILMALAAPAMQEFRIRANVSATTNDLVAALNLARAEAVKRGRDVAVIAASGDWNDGWAVRVVSVTGDLNVRGALDPDYSIATRPIGGGTTDQVTFGATGALRGATGFEISVCRPTFSPGAEQSRWITVAATGAIRSRRNTTLSPAGDCG